MTSNTARAFQNVADIPPLDHKEAGELARVEVERFAALLESLSEGDWLQPTNCTLWNVQQMVCHQAGAYAGWAKWAEFRRQWLPMPQPKPGQYGVDGINDLQVADRSGSSPAQLIAELRAVAPKAIVTRQRIPAFIRGLRFEAEQFLRAWKPSQMIGALRSPYGPTRVSFRYETGKFKGLMRLDYITDLIYIRDTWMHRIDICLATGRTMLLTENHDGRLMALVMRDLDEQLKDVLGNRAVAFDIPGPGGGCFKIGNAATPEATIQMDLLYFHTVASGRMAVGETRSRGLVSISGDKAVGDLAFNQMAPILY